MNEDYLREIDGQLVNTIPEHLKDASIKEQNDFFWALDWKNYFYGLYFQVRKLNELIETSQYYSLQFQKDLIKVCKEYLKNYIENEYITGNVTILGLTFKRYVNDPRGLDLTPDNIDKFLWDFYNKVDKNPWNDSPREYTPDWFDKVFMPSVIAFKKVWGSILGLDHNKNQTYETAIKMLIIESRVPNYYD